ncbi:MAG TPA: T9SS type A sorting domain-containing protein [Puia sp.]|nr:T9SS type A sorting domain-containing protein [Puia sp.]
MSISMKLILPAVLFLPMFCVQKAGAQLIVQNGASLITNGAGHVALQNTGLVCNGTVSQGPGGTFSFSGSGNDSITGSMPPLFDQLEIAKAGGARLLLKQGLTVNSSVLFSGGIIDLDGNILSLSSAASLTGEGETSYITGAGGGSVQIATTAAGAPSALNLGNLGAVITSGSDLGALQVSRWHVPAVNPANGAMTGIQRSFAITPANDVALNATLRFYYLNEELNGKDPNGLGLWSSGDGVKWSFVGADSRDATQKFVEKAGIASFSVWTLSDATSPLPVRLINFSAVCGSNDVVVKWTTAGETGFADFVVEKSSNASDWIAIATIPGSNDPLGASYGYTDAQPAATAYYRLKMVDKDGQFTYSPVFSGGCSDLTMPFALYPNPAVSSITARISVRQGSAAAISVFNAAGQAVETIGVSLVPGANSIPLPINSLPAGIYFVQAVMAGGEIQRGAFVKK